MDGVLKSWRFPRPFRKPADKRLAVKVEDTRSSTAIRGIIPEGNYGAGTVIVWIAGCGPARGRARRIRKGKLLFELRGYKRMALDADPSSRRPKRMVLIKERTPSSPRSVFEWSRASG